MLGRSASAGAPFGAIAGPRLAARAWLDRARRRELPGAASLVLLVAGAVTLVAWAFGIQPLVRGHPALSPVRPDLGLWFLLAGLALWLGRERYTPFARALAAGCALLAAGLGAVTLLEHLLGRHLGIEGFLVPASSARVGTMRMGPLTAVEATLAGLAIALTPVRTRHGRAPAVWLAWLVMGIAAGSAVVHLYRAVAAFSPAPAMVLPAVALFLLVGTVVRRAARPAVQRPPSARADALGLLAAGISHDINNPLAVVLANLDLALQDLDRRGPGLQNLRAGLQDARDGAERVSRIVHDLRLFARPPQAPPTPVDVNALLDTCLRLVLNQFRHRARVVTQYAALPPVLANESQLAQLFLQQLVLAAQTLPERGGQDHEVRLATSRRPDGQVVVEVAGSELLLSPAAAQ